MALVNIGTSKLPVNIGEVRDEGSDPWVGVIPWRRAWKPLPVVFPGESHGQRSLVDHSPRGLKELDVTEATKPSTS